MYVAVAGRLDDRARRAVQLEAADVAPVPRGVFDHVDGRVARIAHGGKRLRHLLRHLRAGEPDPA